MDADRFDHTFQEGEIKTGGAGNPAPHILRLSYEVLTNPKAAIYSIVVLLFMEVPSPLFQNIFLEIGYSVFLFLYLTLLIIYVKLYQQRHAQEKEIRKKVPYVGQMVFLKERTESETWGWGSYLFLGALWPIVAALDLLLFSLLIFKIITTILSLGIV